MGLGYNTFLLYPRPITLEKDICGFIGVVGCDVLFSKIPVLPNDSLCPIYAM